jgi:hypothetical protein
MKKYANGMTVMEIIAWEMARLENKKRTKAEEERLAYAKKTLANEKDDGRIGKVFEALFVGEKSRKKRCSKQGKVDNYFYLDGKRYPVEYKINGGRIESLYKHTKPEKAFIVYGMEFTTKVTKKKDGSLSGGELRVVTPVIMTVKDFLTVIETLNAWKVLTDKSGKERAVQGDSTKLWKVLNEYPIPFNPENHYSSADFEDIELF